MCDETKAASVALAAMQRRQRMGEMPAHWARRLQPGYGAFGMAWVVSGLRVRAWQIRFVVIPGMENNAPPA